MRIIMISFDALEYELVERYNCKILMQEEYGKIDLDPYLDNRPEGRGSGNPLTPGVYSVFITGEVPEDWNVMFREFDKLYKTIFQLSKKALAIDVPAYCKYNKSWMDKLTGSRLVKKYWDKEISLQDTEQEYYKYMDIKASYANLVKLLGYDLVMFYFKEPDKLQHMYYDYDKYEKNFKRLYNKMEDLTMQIISSFPEEDTLIIVFSDHGSNLAGTHSQYGFWSSNKPLGRGNSIEVTDWYGIMKEWYEKPTESTLGENQDEYTGEEREKIKNHLKEMGYME